MLNFHFYDPFPCVLDNYSPSLGNGVTSVAFTLDTTVAAPAFDSEDANVGFIGTYDVLFRWYETVPASPGFLASTIQREAVIRGGFTIDPPPNDDVADALNPDPKQRTPFTWFPGQTPVLNAPPGSAVQITSVEGTYRLSKFSQAAIFPVLKANGHIYGGGYAYVRITYGTDNVRKNIAVFL